MLKRRRRRRERRERRKGGEGVTFAPGTSGDDDDDDDRRLGDDERLGERGGRGVARGRTFLEWLVFVLGVVLQIALDVAIMFTPSIKSRQRRFGVADHARRRRAADASKPAEAPPRRVGGGEEDDEFRSARRGTAGARQRALDRADVPPELRGRVSAARWKQELRAFHEEQVRLAAAQRRVAGEAAPDAASARRKKARERATEHARREVR